MPEDLLNGFNAGLGLVDRYNTAKQQAIVNDRTDQYHQDALGIQQSQLDLDERRRLDALGLGQSNLSLEERRRLDALGLGQSHLSLEEKRRLDALGLGQSHLSLEERRRLDVLGIQQGQLGLESQRTSAYKQEIESEVAIRDKMFQWQSQQRDKRKKELDALVNLDKQVTDWMFKPLDPTTAPSMVDQFKQYSYLFNSDDPLVKSDATALRDKAMAHFQNSVQFPVIQQQTRAIASGFMKPGDAGTPGAANGVMAQDASDARTMANSAGVNLDDPKFQTLMESLKYTPSGGYTDESKAKIKRAIESEAASAQRALPDKESKVKLGFGKFDKFAGKYSNEATLSLQDVLSNPEIQKQVQSILQSQGTPASEAETFTGTAADEAGKPRVVQNGHTFRWSQSTGRYVYMGPVASLSPTESPLPIAPR
jgi:hypothetical protein